MNPTVLYLTHRVPFPPDKGDRIRNWHVLRQLVRRGSVWLACLADEPVPPETIAELNRVCGRVAIVPVTEGRWLRAGWSVLTGGSISEGAFWERDLMRVVRAWCGETTFSAAVISASSLAPYLRMRELADVPKIVDLVDVDSQKWSDFADAARGPKKWMYRLESHRIRKLERGLPQWTKAVAMVSRAEAAVFDSFAGAGAATVAANGVDLEYFTAPAADAGRLTMATDAGRLACAFVGAMDYLPNVDAAVWFARDIWPAIHAKFPSAEFRIIGRKPSPEVQRLANLPGVNLIGQVPDVRPFVAEATIAVVPLRLARGIQNKVLEAMAMAKPVIAAPPALAALKAVPGTHLLSASATDDWVKCVSELFADPTRCRELGAAARRFVEEHHHWETCLEPLMERVFHIDL
ncbi:MAG: TIGR03087 family PEP-CTERM/XrtA system glycosyltransferase [Gemmataceae bacterium]